MLRQKRLFLATMAKWAIDDCFSGIMCSEHKIAFKNTIIHSLPWITMFLSLVMWFAKSLVNHITRDQKIVIHGNSCIILYIYIYIHIYIYSYIYAYIYIYISISLYLYISIYIYQYHNFNGGIFKLQLKLWHEWVICSYINLWAVTWPWFEWVPLIHTSNTIIPFQEVFCIVTINLNTTVLHFGRNVTFGPT